MKDFEPLFDPHTYENGQSAAPGRFGTKLNLSVSSTCTHPGFENQPVVGRAQDEGLPCCLFLNIHQLVGGLIVASLSCAIHRANQRVNSPKGEACMSGLV